MSWLPDGEKWETRLDQVCAEGGAYLLYDGGQFAAVGEETN
jgi:hypothetical protein